MLRRQIYKSRQVVVMLLVLLLTGCAGLYGPPKGDRILGPTRGSSRLILERVDFSDLPDWKSDHHAAILPVFMKSCGRLHN